MSDTVDIDEIERLARAATPGPWGVRGEIAEGDNRSGLLVEMGADRGPVAPTAFVTSWDDSTSAADHANAAFIAAASPAVVLAMVERIRRLQTEVERAERIADENRGY